MAAICMASHLEVHIVEDDEDFTDERFETMLLEVDQEASEYDLADLEVHLTEAGGETAQPDEKPNDDAKALSLVSFSHRSSSDDHSLACTKDATIFEVFHSEPKTEGQYIAASLETHGVPDTPCRRSLMGAAVLERRESHVNQAGMKVLRKPHATTFRFGNAEVLQSREIPVVPFNLLGRKVVFSVAVLPGKGAHTPFLMSKEMLRSLRAIIDTNDDTVKFTRLGNIVPLA